MSSFRSHLNNRAWIGIVLSFYAFIAIGIVEGGLGVLIPSIQATFNLNNATITLLFLGQASGYMFAALASGSLGSHIGLARMLLLASISLTCAIVTYAVSPYWLLMIVAGTFLGLGIGLIDAGINSYIANHQGSADLIGLLHAFYGLGAFLGPTIATTLLAMNVNWRGVYLAIAAIVTFTVLGMLWAVISNYKPFTQSTKSQNSNATLNLRIVFRTPAVLIAALFLLVYVGTEISIGNWAYSVQTVSRGTPEVLAGYSISAYWLGLTLGRLVTGRVVKYLGATRTLDSALTLLAVSLIAWWLLPTQLLILPIMGFALAPIFPLTIWLMPQRIPVAIVPVGIGFMTSVASLGAAGIPAGIGAIADQMGLEIIPVLMIPLVAVMVILHRWLVKVDCT